MLRKVRVDGPPERLDDLLNAARHAELDIDDWAVDTTTEYGWPGRADGHAYVLVVVEDEVFRSDAVVRAVRAGYQAMAGPPSDWIVPGGSFVFLPDGLEPAWYDEVVPLAEALHAAEDAGDRDRTADLRREITRRIDEVLPLSERRLDAFAAFVGPDAPASCPDGAFGVEQARRRVESCHTQTQSVCELPEAQER